MSTLEALSLGLNRLDQALAKPPVEEVSLEDEAEAKIEMRWWEVTDPRQCARFCNEGEFGINIMPDLLTLAATWRMKVRRGQVTQEEANRCMGDAFRQIMDQEMEERA